MPQPQPQPSPLLSEVLSHFLLAKSAANRSSRTILWYENQLKFFCAFLGEIEIDRIQPGIIDAYLADQRKSGIADSTLHARFRSVRALFTWATRRGYIHTNPVLQIEAPSQGTRKPKHITYPEFLCFLQAIPDRGAATWLDYRDRLIAHLLFWSGFRANELLSLWRIDLHTARGTADVLRGKGDKDRIVPLSPKVESALVPYLYSRPLFDGPELILGSDGDQGTTGPLGVAGLEQMLRRRCAAAGIDHYHPHSWRHGFAMHMLEYGAELHYIGDVMGHANYKTTKDYARWLERIVASRFDEVFRKTER